MLINRVRAVEWMERYRLDALIATHWLNVLYLSDFFLWLNPLFRSHMVQPGAPDGPLSLYGLLPRESEPAIVLAHDWELNAADLWITHRYVYTPRGLATLPTIDTTLPITESGAFKSTDRRSSSPEQALSRALADAGLADARIGADLRYLPDHRLQVIREVLGTANLVDATELFRFIRMVKSPEELRRLRRATQIADRAAAASVGAARRGCNFQDLVSSFRWEVARQGADFDHFACSLRGIGMASEISANFTANEALFLDYGCVYGHYFSDAGTTLLVGEPTESVRNTLAEIAASIDEAAQLLRPGIRSSAIHTALARAFEDRRLRGHFPHGHSLGLEIREYPILVPDSGEMIKDDCICLPSDIALEAGMVINLEAPVFNLSGNAFQFEQSYLITPTGHELLVNEPRIPLRLE